MPHAAPLTASLWGRAEPAPIDGEIVRRVAERAQDQAERRRLREALDAARAEWKR